jgi:hypothetical protein
MYELGKGMFHIIFPPSPEDSPKFLYRETFVSHFIYNVNSYYSDYRFGTNNKEENTKYFTALANTLFDFIDGADPETELKIANDCDDSNYDYRDQGYIYIGSRYIMIQDYNDYIINGLNNHSKTDLSKMDFTIPMDRIRKMLILL